VSKELVIGDVTASRGEFKKGILGGVKLINGSSIDIPFMVMNGVEDGPTLLLTSTQHGVELQGIEVIRKVMREILDPKLLRGAVIGIPVANPLAFFHYQYRSWTDNQDVGIVRADMPDGGSTERLTYTQWTEAWSKADMIINIHCNSRPSALIYQWINIGNPKTKEKLEKMAKAFGVTTIVSDRPISEDAPPTLGNLSASNGIPVILYELIDGRWISEPSTSAGVKGVLNTMKAFDMIDGEPEAQEGFPIVPGAGTSMGPRAMQANASGLIRFLKLPGEPIKEGEVYAEVYDLYGDVLEQIKMPFDGYVWANLTTGNVIAILEGSGVGYVFKVEEN